MESYTSDSSDSDSSAKTLDLAHQSLDAEELERRLERAVAAAEPGAHVETLLLQHNRLGRLPEAPLLRLGGLATLDVSNCGLERLPEALGRLGQLVSLAAKNNGLSNDRLPKSLEGAVSLRELNLSGNRLTELPEQVLGLTALKYLYLGGNLIGEITEDVWRLQGLQVLSIGGNRLTEVPSGLGRLTSLQALVLFDNRLESLPSSIANLKNLKSLLLHKNRLRTLPTEIITLKCLTELSLRDNPLVVRFVSDMTHNPPSLLELAARLVKTNEIPYREEDLPRSLIDYLNSGHRCVNSQCKGVFFDNRVEHVKFVDFCGKYRLPLMQYLCSSRCIEPRAAAAQGEDVVSGAMMRKVLLG